LLKVSQEVIRVFVIPNVIVHGKKYFILKDGLEFGDVGIKEEDYT
jgi:hypothetical protein